MIMNEVAEGVRSRRLARIAREEAMRAAGIDRLAIAIGVIMLIVMVGYMLVGDRPFRPSLEAASDISPINRYVWIGLMALAVPVLWLRRADLPAMARQVWPLLLLYFWFFLSTSWALDPASSTRRAVQSCFSVVCCAAIALGVRRAERIHWLVCIPCIAVVTVDLASWFVVPGIAMTPIGLQGMHAQKNMLGEFSMFTLLAGVTCLFNPLPRLGRLAISGGMAVALLTLLASRSGTSAGLIFAAAAILPALVIVLRRRGATSAAALIALGLALVAALALYVMWCGVSGADPLAPLAGVTFTRRTDLWAFLIENIQKRPWAGSGYGSFWAIDPAVQPSLNSGLWFGRKGFVAPERHDAYLDLAATTGLIGLAMGLFVLVRAIAQAGAAVRLAPRALPLPTAAFQLGLTLIVMGHSFTESTLFAPDNQLSALFMLGLMGLARARAAYAEQTKTAPLGPVRRRIGDRHPRATAVAFEPAWRRGARPEPHP